MRGADLQRLYDYNYWASRALFGMIEQLTPDQFGSSSCQRSDPSHPCSSVAKSFQSHSSLTICSPTT
jgi:hypothetical protein